MKEYYVYICKRKTIKKLNKPKENKFDKLHKPRVEKFVGIKCCGATHLDPSATVGMTMFD